MVEEKTIISFNGEEKNIISIGGGEKYIFSLLVVKKTNVLVFVVEK